VNFVTVHDGFTLFDLFAYDNKRNGCGLLNPTCCNDRYSAFCDLDSGESHNRSRNWGQPCGYPEGDVDLCNADPFCVWNGSDCVVEMLPSGFEGEAFRRQLMRNTFETLLMSHGTPMLYGGD
jgi:glycogen operon protein